MLGRPRDRARRTSSDPKPSRASCLKSPQTPNMPTSHLSRSTNVQTALSRPLLSLTAATAVTAAAACAAYFLGGGVNATVRNLLVVDHVPWFSSAVFLRCVTGFGILCAHA